MLTVETKLCSQMILNVFVPQWVFTNETFEVITDEFFPGDYLSADIEGEVGRFLAFPVDTVDDFVGKVGGYLEIFVGTTTVVTAVVTTPFITNHHL